MAKSITRIGIGGPVGSGKTAIIEAITPKLVELGVRVMIITNDVVTTEDAKHVQRTLKGMLVEERIIGVETGACPHTAVREDPSMNLAAVEDMESRFPETDVVLIESGGDNLTLTFSPALVDYFIYVIDVAAGDKIPRKNGPGITQSDILIINKTDLAPHVGASLEVMEHDSRLMRGEKPFLFTNCKTGAGDRRTRPIHSRERLVRPPPQEGRSLTPTHPPRELAPYQDEPKQLPTGSIGKDALLRMRFERRGARSILAFMERRAPLIVQKALYCDEGMPDLPFVFIITNSGGVLQGDRYAIEIRVARDAFAHVTTQAATKIHEMDANHAIQTQEIVLEEGAYLELLPDQIIPYRRSRFLTRTRLEIHPTATLLYSEILICGRKYYRDGECFLFDLFSSTVHAERPDGSDLFTEKFVIEPGREDPRATGAMGGFDVFGNVILLTPRRHADAILAQAPAVFDRETQCAAGASRLPNDAGLIYKVLGMETEPVRAKIRAFWSLVRPEVAGFPVPPDFSWR